MSNVILIKVCRSVLMVYYILRSMYYNAVSILEVPDRRGQLMLLNLEVIDVIHKRKLVGVIGIVYMRSPVWLSALS